MIEAMFSLVGVVIGAAAAYAYCRSSKDGDGGIETKSGGGPGEEK